MMRLIAVLLLLGGLPSGGGIPSSAESPARKMPFCPECWKFVDDPGDLDAQGRCLASGKKPVQVESAMVSWVWCRAHHAWHRQPCARDFSAPFESPALLIPVGSQFITVRPYCPGDRMMSDLGHVGLKCPVCSRPFVGATMVDRQWYGCATEKAWLTSPCRENAKAQCCSIRSGFILAYPWCIPFLSQISTGKPVRKDMRVTPQWLAAHLDDPHLVVLHVGFDATKPEASSRPTYLDGHIVGARSIAWDEMAVARKGIPNEMPPAETLVRMVRSLGIDVEDRIVLYDTGSGLEAARAYLTLDYLGLGDTVSLLDGHWASWKALALPVSRMAEEVEPSSFLPRLRPEILVSLPAMKDLSWLSQHAESSVAILDARSAEEYSGSKAGQGIWRAGHIAGAANLCWKETLEDGQLRSEDELRAMFEATRARPGRTVVVYCRTGVEASHLYFLAKYLGYTARFYDGSYFEWSREEDVTIQGNWARR